MSHSLTQSLTQSLSHSLSHSVTHSVTQQKVSSNRLILSELIKTIILVTLLTFPTWFLTFGSEKMDFWKKKLPTESCQEALLSTNPVSEVDYWVQNVKNWKSRGMGRLTLQKQKNYIWSDFLSKNGFWNFLFCCNPFRSANFRRL